MLSASLPRVEKHRSRADTRRQTVIGLGLAAAILTGWLAVHLTSLFFLSLSGLGWCLAPAVIALQCWLSVGLFILSHDAMHGSLAPFRPRLNRTIGRVALMLYGGIWYDDLVARHFAHHRSPGTEHDPDFYADGRPDLGRWFLAFFREYVTPGQMMRQTCVAALYLMVFHVPADRLLLFWAAPALLSAVQLFYFGTYLPHRHEAAGFIDDHRARSNDFSYPLSLATCFHFGYHHEHHADPSVPWWNLPARRAVTTVDR